MWWVLQIIACAGVTVAQVVNKYYGVCFTSWVVYVMIATLTYWGFVKSYMLAPNFFSAWFVGQAALGVLGVLAAVLFFKDQVNTYQWIGMIMVIVGGYFLVKL
jgi:uncharacterized membrane protein